MESVLESIGCEFAAALETIKPLPFALLMLRSILRSTVAISNDAKQGSKQVAALPMRRTADGALQVLLVTSRESRRWVIPKGWPWEELPGHLAAAEEAWEEAGVRGRAGAEVIGRFSYEKRRSGKSIAIEVSVYPLDVIDIFDTWPESAQRERAWFSVPDAAAAIAEPELREIMLSLA